MELATKVRKSNTGQRGVKFSPVLESNLCAVMDKEEVYHLQRRSWRKVLFFNKNSASSFNNYSVEWVNFWYKKGI